MLVTDKGQVTIPKPLRDAAGIAPGTELLLPSPDPAAIDDLLDVFEAKRSALPWGCAASTARAFAAYRSRGGTKSRLMPDFYIGAHAAFANLSVLTRDPAGYRRHYPKLRVISP